VQVRHVAKEAKDAKAVQVALPQVFLSPIRPDIVHFVHTNMAKNRRQPYAVSEMAGMQHSAESWGTGRAVARIPRVSGGGNSRSGQGAFGNMCRKGRMFAPTQTWRKWHRKINTNQKRYAVCSALAASALPSLVLARGHRVDQVPEIPLVVDDSVQAVHKTKEAIAALKAVGAYDDVVKAKESRKLRCGVGKSRNRRHVQRRGPLVVYSEDKGLTQAFRNLPGVELARVDALNLLQLAPGGHLGRFIVWTKSAFEKLGSIFGSQNRESSQKKGFKLPRNIMLNSDITRIINSDEVQSKVRPAVKEQHRFTQKKNPLKNFGVMVRLNPYAMSLRRAELLSLERQQKAKTAKLQAAREKKQVPVDRSELKQKAADRTHDPQQKVNYKRILIDDFKAPKLKLVIQKTRPPQAPPAPKAASEKKKHKRHKRTKEQKREEKKKKDEAEKKRIAELLAKIPVGKKAKAPKVKKAGGGGKAKGKEKGKEAAKGEKGKEAAKGGAKGEAAKGEAAKAGAAKKEAPKKKG
jgi:large subunit ribosomal protein L4e